MLRYGLQLHSQTLVKAAPTGCLHVNICMCMTLAQLLLPSLHMNRAQRTLEVYNFLRESPVAGHLVVWVRGTKGPAPRTKKPSGRLQQLAEVRGCTGWSTVSERWRAPGQTQQGAKKTHFHPGPPSGVNKVITSRGGCPRAAKCQIICLMAQAAL